MRSLTTPTTAVAVRAATAHDHQALTRLAGLDEAPALRGEALLAELDGRVVAALERSTGRVVADPFVHTAAARQLLAVRARQLNGRRVRNVTLRALAWA